MKRIGERLLRDQTGGVLVETTVMLLIIFVFVLGSVDFLMAMYQWNAAAKAVQVGARIAAVSNPVVTNLPANLCGSDKPGDFPPQCSYILECAGGSTSPDCSGPAMNTIVFGRGSASCNDAGGASFYSIGMCDVFPLIAPTNVRVRYESSGLGYAGRPGGPVPTITVSLQNLNFQFFFLGGLMGFGNITIPSLATTITGEDLSTSWAP